MTRQSHYPLIVVCLFLEYASSQYKTYQMKHSMPPACSDSSKNTLVEHFFNLIFSEFQNNPPICVCVQMCSNQPTYCYPNGCLKKPETKVSTHMPQLTTQAPTLLYQVQKDEMQPKSFIVHDQSEFMSKLLDRNYIADKLPGPKYSVEKPALMPFKSQNDLHPEIITDSFKSIFKYKKIPKVHLRYNLREQVKNTKSDVVKIEKIDMTKTRWPTHKRSQFFLERVNDVSPDDSETVKVSPSISLESGQAVLPNKFFKRDIKKNDKMGESKVFYDTGDNNVTQLLENLIDNLIEKRFGNLPNDTELDFNVNVDYTISNVTTQLPEIYDTKFPHLPENVFSNDTTAENVLSGDFKSQRISQSKYTGEDMYKNIYNEMIAALSKNIDKQYNSTLQLMEKIVGNTEVNEDQSYITTESVIDITQSETNTGNECKHTVEVKSSQSLLTSSSITKREITRKKSKQRINRKLKHSKLN